MAYIYELLEELKKGEKITSKKFAYENHLYIDGNHNIIKNSMTERAVELTSKLLQDDTFYVVKSKYIWNLKYISEIRNIDKLDLATIQDIIFNEIKEEIESGLNVRDEKYIDIYTVKNIILKRFFGDLEK